MEGGTPPEVEGLIALALSSMLHVELLLLLHRTAPAPWNVSDAAVELRMTVTLVEPARLAALADYIPLARMLGRP